MNEAIRSWRRRIAAMRVYHLLAMGSVVIGVVVGLEPLIRDLASGKRATLDVDSVVAAILLISFGIVGHRVYAFRRYCMNELPGSLIDPTDFPAVKRVHAEVQDFLVASGERLSFHCLFMQDVFPAQLLHTGDGLHVLLSFDLLWKSDSEADLLAGVVWHEVGHHLQWVRLSGAGRFGPPK